MHAGDVDLHAPPAGAEPEHHRGAFLGQRCLIGVVIALVFVVVVLPLLVWAAGIAAGH